MKTTTLVFPLVSTNGGVGTTAYNIIVAPSGRSGATELSVIPAH
jgi:hypothetical protein